MDLVQTYDTERGPLWQTGSEVSGTFNRDSMTNDNIHWAMFHVMQYIMDDTYNSTNIQSNRTLLENYKFGSADVFPGEVTPPANPTTTHTTTINGSFPKTWGRDTMHWSEPAVVAYCTDTRFTQNGCAWTSCIATTRMVLPWKPSRSSIAMALPYRASSDTTCCRMLCLPWTFLQCNYF